MSYFSPNKRKILKIILDLTLEKPYADFHEVESKIPKSWRLKGCGTGNIQKVIVNLYREKLIESAGENHRSFMEGREIGNKSFFLSLAGRNELKPWAQRNWQVVAGFLVSVATITTAVYAAMQYYKK
jgi:hypothetical protein